MYKVCLKLGRIGQRETEREREIGGLGRNFKTLIDDILERVN